MYHIIFSAGKLPSSEVLVLKYENHYRLIKTMLISQLIQQECGSILRLFNCGERGQKTVVLEF